MALAHCFVPRAHGSHLHFLAAETITSLIFFKPIAVIIAADSSRLIRRLMLLPTDSMSKGNNGSTFLRTPGLQMFIVFVPADVNRRLSLLLLLCCLLTLDCDAHSLFPAGRPLSQNVAQSSSSSLSGLLLCSPNAGEEWSFGWTFPSLSLPSLHVA